MQRFVPVPIVERRRDQRDELEPAVCKSCRRLGQRHELVVVTFLGERLAEVHLADCYVSTSANRRRERGERSVEATPDEASAEAERDVVRLRRQRKGRCVVL